MKRVQKLLYQFLKILSKNPYLNPETVREMLRQSADDIGDPGYDIETGYGKVNAYESILLVPSQVSGDINLDGTVNISDVVILVDEILFGSYITSGDINADGINNINDIGRRFQFLFHMMVLVNQLIYYPATNIQNHN